MAEMLLDYARDLVQRDDERERQKQEALADFEQLPWQDQIQALRELVRLFAKRYGRGA